MFQGNQYRAAVARFNAAWNVLSGMGWCDALGGAEWRRIFLQWLKAGAPESVNRYIRRHANERVV